MPDRRPYVRAADWVRAVTVTTVVAVHSTWYMADGGHWISSGTVLSLLHYTRESFMALTGFVLSYTLFGRPIHWIPMLLRRFRLVLFPYVLWSAVFMLLFRHFSSVGDFATRYGTNLLDGEAWFHLYYVLVTMQFYLLLPLFLLLMRWAAQRPFWVAGAAILAQLALSAFDQYFSTSHGVIQTHVSEEVWTYTGDFVLGGVAAVHWPRVRGWLRRHMRLVALVSVGTAGIMLGQFFWQAIGRHNLIHAEAVVQPAMIPWALSVVVLLTALGVRYEDALNRNPHRWKIVKWLADLSFGIYLIHPLFLQYWTGFLSWMHWYHPSYWLDMVTVALLVTVSSLATKLLGLTPVSPYFIGRAALPPGTGQARLRHTKKER
jgi:peptidoglycan/LPS O-acetylase OafA/YrhL